MTLYSGTIRHMRVPFWPIRRTGSWGYLAGSWREATPNVIIILINVRENEKIIFGCVVEHVIVDADVVIIVLVEVELQCTLDIVAALGHPFLAAISHWHWIVFDLHIIE